jgi:beta-lactamase regulating signal transducer with metallopeptidase domain
MISEIFMSGSFLWSCLWQSTIFLVAGLLGSFLLRRRSARAHRMLFLAMMAAVTVPAVSLLVKHYELGLFVAEPVVIQPASENRAIHEATDIISNETIERKPAPIKEDLHTAIAVSRAAKFPWRSALLYTWIAASLILTTRLLVTFVLGVRLLGRTLPLDCDKIEHAVHLAKTKLGINRDVKIFSSLNILSPVIWCWGRKPVLLIPGTTELSDMDLTGVLCHELAHYKRRDHVAGLLAELTVCILPWHPLLWWAKSHLISLSEQACDDWVIASDQSGTDYAESLLNLIPEGQMAFVPAVVHSKKSLTGRVRRILKDNCGNPRTGATWALTASTIAICLAIGIAFAQTKTARSTGTVKTKFGKSAVIEQPAFPVTMIKGRILDPNNEPAYGARIIALPVTSYSDYIKLNNKEGSFELPWSPTWIKKDQPIYLMTRGSWQRNEAAFVELHDPASLVTIQLEPSFSLEGKVVDPNGGRLAKYKATLSMSGKFKCQAPILETTVGAPRVDIFSLVPYGPKYKLTIQAEDYQMKELIVDATDRSKEVIDLGTVLLQPQYPTKPIIAEQDTNPDLAKEFHDIYRLDEKEILKFIKAPFVLGRQEYILVTTPSIASYALQTGGHQYGFHWDGELKAYSAYGTTSPVLSKILWLVVGLQEYKFEIPKGLDVHLPHGDWIVRADSTRNEQLRCLEEIISIETNRAIRFEERTSEREVIIASGRYEFKPHPNGNYPNYIPLWDGRLQTAEYTADSLEHLFDSIERELKMKIVDETEPMEISTIRYKWIKLDPEPIGDKLSVLLYNLAKTTSLQFKVERRPAQVWFVTEETEN